MLNTVQLESFLRRRYGEVKKQRGKYGPEMLVRCPVCGKKNKLSVNANTGKYKCWHGCSSGHINDLTGDLKIAQMDAAIARRDAPVHREVILPGPLTPLLELAEEHPAISYLMNRGFSIQELNDVYGMRYCAQGRSFMDGLFNTSNTIIIPIYRNGEVIGWQSRLLYNPDSLDDATCAAFGWPQDEDGDYKKPPKYFTMPGFDKGKNVWNYDWARRSEIVVVTEGIFDAMAVGRCAVATFGKGVSDNQVSLLKYDWKLIVMLLDPDVGTKGMEDLNNKWGKGSVNTLYLMLEGYKDAGEAPRMEIWRQIDAAIKRNKTLAAGGITLDSYKFLV